MVYKIIQTFSLRLICLSPLTPTIARSCNFPIISENEEWTKACLPERLWLIPICFANSLLLAPKVKPDSVEHFLQQLCRWQAVSWLNLQLESSLWRRQTRGWSINTKLCMIIRNFVRTWTLHVFVRCFLEQSFCFASLRNENPKMFCSSTLFGSDWNSIWANQNFPSFVELHLDQREEQQQKQRTFFPPGVEGLATINFASITQSPWEVNRHFCLRFVGLRHHKIVIQPEPHSDQSNHSLL